MPEEAERIDIQTAAAKYGRNPTVIYHLIRRGKISSQRMRVRGRTGRFVYKHMLRVEELEKHFDTSARERHIAAIEAAAPPLSEKQKEAIRGAFFGD